MQLSIIYQNFENEIDISISSSTRNQHLYNNYSIIRFLIFYDANYINGLSMCRYFFLNLVISCIGDTYRCRFSEEWSGFIYSNSSRYGSIFISSQCNSHIICIRIIIESYKLIQCPVTCELSLFLRIFFPQIMNISLQEYDEVRMMTYEIDDHSLLFTTSNNLEKASSTVFVFQ